MQLGILHAQRHAPCGGNPVPLSNTCADACLVCDLNGVSARTTNTIQGQSPPGYCTMVVHSMQWLAFVAGSTSLTINVRVSACNQNNGVEMGIYASDDCQTFRLVSNCNTNMYNNQTWAFTTTEPLKPGCIYYLVFDGNGPNSCQVDFTVVSGSTTAPTPTTSNKITGKTLVCVGESADYFIAPIFGACEYEWRVENGSLMSSLDNRATVLWDQPGKGKICVKGTNACKDGNEVCLDVEIGEESPPTELGPFYVCFGESYRYKNTLFTAGTWQFNHKNRFGCDSNTVIIVENLDLLQTELDTFLCDPDSLLFGNKRIDTSGRFKATLKSKVSPFCDSTVFLNVTYSKVRPAIHKSGDLSCLDTLVTLYSDSSVLGNKSSTQYYWRDSLGNLLSTADSCIVKKAGRYVLELIYTADTIHRCSKSTSIVVFGSVNPPDLYLTDTLKFCSGSDIGLYSLPVADLNNTLALWSFHSALPCDSSNRIPDSTILLLRDTLIYLKAKIAHCEDVIPIPISIHQLEHIFIDDQEFCSGTDIDLSKLRFVKDGNFGGAPVFYNCPLEDSSCLINVRFNLLNDSLIYVISDSSVCPEFTSFHVKALRIPDAGFTLNAFDLCLHDSLQIMLSNRQAGEHIFLNFNQSESEWLDSNSLLLIPQTDTGRFNICIRKTEKQCADTSCQSFNVHPLPQLPNPQCLSTDSTVLFSWNQNGKEIYTVDTLLGGPFLKLSDTSILFYNLSRGQSIRIRVTAGSPYCGSVSADLSCESKTCPPISVGINPVDTICVNEGMPYIKLTAVSDSVVSNGLWIWRGPGIVDSLQGLFDPQLAGAGNHRIFVMLENLGCRYFSSTTLVLRYRPISNFIMDSIICQDSALLIRFNGKLADSAIFDWKLDGATFQFLNGQKELKARWKTPGKKSILLALNHFKCFDSSFKSVEVLEPLPLPEIECETTDSIIRFRWKKMKRVKAYKIQHIFGNAGTRLNDTTYVIVKRNFGDSAAIQLILEDEGPCSEVKSAVISCKSPDCPPRNILSDTILQQCDKLPFNFSLKALIRDPLPLYSWSGAAIHSDSVEVDKLGPGTYLYLFEGEQFGCRYKDSFTLQIHPHPGFGFFNIDPIPCDPLKPFGSVSLTGVRSKAPPVLFSTNGGAYQSDSTFSNLPEGSYTVSLKDANGCTTDSSFYLDAPEIPIIDVGPDHLVLKGEIVQLNALITGTYSSIYWSSPVDLSCQACEDPWLQPKQAMRLFCTIINEDGCIATDSLEIRIFENKVFAPNVFSPNGDQINDFFTLFGNLSEIKLLEIYDRWGNRVFVKEHFAGNRPDLGWNGSFKNEKVLPGVYIYRAIVGFEKGDDRLLHGDLTVVR